MTKKRIYILITMFCFVICLMIVKFLDNHQFIRGFIGDVVITILIYSFIKIFIKIDSLKLSVLVLLFSFTVEYMQYLRLINHIGLGDSKIAKIIIGSTFDFRDLIAYVIGITFIYLIDTRFLKN